MLMNEGIFADYKVASRRKTDLFSATNESIFIEN